MTPPPDPNGADPKGSQPPSPIDLELTSESFGKAGMPGAPVTPEQVFFSETQLDLSRVPEKSASKPEVAPAPEVGRSAPLSPPAASPASTVSPGGPSVPTPAPKRNPPRRTPSEIRNRARFLTFLRLFTGWMLLFVLAYFMWVGGEWPTKLLAWVLLAILADEFAGWFGYIGLLLGGLGYFSPTPPPDQWVVILPLVGGALFALLLIKHSGGPLVLPFAGALFAGTLFVAAKFGLKFDPALKLPSNETFLRSAMLAMLVGLGVSFVRQFIGLYLRRRARIRARQEAEPISLPGTA